MPGCGWIGSGKAAVREAPEAGPEIRWADPGAAGAEGAVAFVVPTAGAGVPANEQTERLALKVVQGFHDRLAGDGDGWTFVAGDDLDRAAWILDGHIVTWRRPGRWKHWVLREREQTLAVSVEMRERSSGRLALRCRQERSTDNGDLEALAYTIGSDIAAALIAGDGP